MRRERPRAIHGGAEECWLSVGRGWMVLRLMLFTRCSISKKKSSSPNLPRRSLATLPHRREPPRYLHHLPTNPAPSQPPPPIEIQTMAAARLIYSKAGLFFGKNRVVAAQDVLKVRPASPRYIRSGSCGNVLTDDCQTSSPCSGPHGRRLPWRHSRISKSSPQILRHLFPSRSGNVTLPCFPRRTVKEKRGGSTD